MTKSEAAKLAENYYNDPQYLVEKAFDEGIKAAISEIIGWEELQELNFKTCPFKYPDEAAREHGNTMRLLAVIKSKLGKKLLIPCGTESKGEK